MRYYYNRKATADESCKLQISRLKKDGMLLSGQTTEKISWTSSLRGKTTTISVTVDITDDPHARLIYSVTDQNGSKADYDYQVSLATTPCNFSGVRYWFYCPTCGERVAVLYLAPGNVHFQCRKCNNLSYRSRNRCTLESFGHTSRQIDQLQSQIKRWTWRGRPTRKVMKLQALQRKMGVLSGPIMARMERSEARL